MDAVGVTLHRKGLDPLVPQPQATRIDPEAVVEVEQLVANQLIGVAFGGDLVVPTGIGGPVQHRGQQTDVMIRTQCLGPQANRAERLKRGQPQFGGTANVAFGGHRPRHRQFDRHQHLHPAQAYPRSAVQGRLRTLPQKLDRGAEHVLVERLLLGNPADLHQCQSRVDVGRSPQAHLQQRIHRPVLVQQHVHPVRHGRVRAGQRLADEAKRQAAILGQEQAVLGIVG